MDTDQRPYWIIHMAKEKYPDIGEFERGSSALMHTYQQDPDMMSTAAAEASDRRH